MPLYCDTPKQEPLTQTRRNGICLYTPGYVHAKVMVADDQEAVVGTINFDDRSVYHNFECAAYLNRVDAISDIKKDFLDTPTKCQTWNYELLRGDKRYIKAMGRLLKVIAPLM